MIFNIFLILYCIAFLVIGLFDNIKLRDLFQTMLNFNSLGHSFYQTALSLYYNIGFYNQNSTDASNYVTNNYWDKFNKNPNTTVDFSVYSNLELDTKLNDLKDKLNNFQGVHLFFILWSRY